jgi:hypothetical protein
LDGDSDSFFEKTTSLLDALRIESGLFVDLGGSVQAPAALPAGLEYVCLTDEPSERGHSTHWVDFGNHTQLSSAVERVVGDKKVACVVIGDLLERVEFVGPFLGALAECHRRLAFPPLIVGVTNIGHVDVLGNLLAGTWGLDPVTRSKERLTRRFTEQTLTESLRTHGFRQIASRDIQGFADHCGRLGGFAATEPTTPLGAFVRTIRNMADENANTMRFVRAYSLSPAPPPESAQSGEQPFLSVIVRTQGKRLGLLEDALTSLAAQTLNDLEVQLVIHSGADEDLESVKSVVSAFDGEFVHRVYLHQVSDGGRSRPLNVGLDAAKGRYIAFLDDDDMVLGNWAAAFEAAVRQHPGHTIRALAADQSFSVDDTGIPRAESGFQHDRDRRFDLLTHFHHNETPICAFALPAITLNMLRLRFDERLPVVEDWDLLVRTAMLTGVHDIEEITSVYRRWISTNENSFSIPPTTWTTARDNVIDSLDSGPVLLPAGSVRQLVDLHEHREATQRELDAARDEIANLQYHLDAVQRQSIPRFAAKKSLGPVLRRVRR